MKPSQRKSTWTAVIVFSGCLGSIGFTMTQTACKRGNMRNCDSVEAHREAGYVSWCEGLCEVSYEAGLSQGLDCSKNSAPYFERVSEWNGEHDTPYEVDGDPDADACGFPTTGACGLYSSHADNFADPFDYGYFDGWQQAGCEGDPAGDDMTRLTWPVLEGDTGPTYTPGYYPCPEVILP